MFSFCSFPPRLSLLGGFLHTLPFCLQTGDAPLRFPGSAVDGRVRVLCGGGWRGKGEEVSLFMWMQAWVCVCVCGCYRGGGVGCLWDLPLSVIEKCDLENVCPAEHESYLHGDGAVLRGGSPGL